MVRIRRTCLSGGFKFDISLNPVGLQHAWLTQTTGCLLWVSSSSRKCLPLPLKSSLCIWQSIAARFLGSEIHINYHLGDRLTYSFFLLHLLLILLLGLQQQLRNPAFKQTVSASPYCYCFSEIFLPVILNAFAWWVSPVQRRSPNLSFTGELPWMQRLLCFMQPLKETYWNSFHSWHVMA